MRTRPEKHVCAALALAIAASGAAAADGVPVYDSTQVPFDRYTIVSRIGVEDWRQSAFRIRSHPTLQAARAALTREAARLGADGVINMICFDQTDRVFRPEGYFCYGNAIRLKKP